MAFSPDQGPGVQCVVGTNVGLEPHFAIKFSVFFYHALALGHTFPGATRIAEDAVALYVCMDGPATLGVVGSLTFLLPVSPGLLGATFTVGVPPSAKLLAKAFEPSPRFTGKVV